MGVVDAAVDDADDGALTDVALLPEERRTGDPHAGRDRWLRRKRTRKEKETMRNREKGIAIVIMEERRDDEG